jgi:hypothetical protein
MEHLSFEIICRIADGDIQQDELAAYSTHLSSCQVCQQEIALQKSIIKVSRQTQLINPSNEFIQNVLDVVNPSKKKKWYEWILQNMGNMIAMAAVLTFLGYVFSMTENGPYQTNKPTIVEPMLDFFKVIQNGSNQFVKYITQKPHLQSMASPQTNTIGFALLAIALLVFIDQIANYFMRQSKV